MQLRKISHIPANILRSNFGIECSKDCKEKSPMFLGTPSKEQSFVDLIESKSIDTDEFF